MATSAGGAGTMGTRKKGDEGDDLKPGQHLWEFHVDGTKHALKFEHNTLTGKRVLWLDGTRIHKVASKFELTGKIKFELGSATVTIAIDSAAYGKLDYTLLVDGKVIKDVRESTQTCKAARWEVYGKKGYIYDVEFDTETFHVYVNGKQMDAAGDFVDVGSAYSFELPEGEAAYVHVIPTKRTDRPIVKLFVDDVEIGSDPKELAASASKK